MKAGPCFPAGGRCPSLILKPGQWPLARRRGHGQHGAARHRENAPWRIDTMFEMLLIGMRFIGAIMYAFLNGEDW